MGRRLLGIDQQPYVQLCPRGDIKPRPGAPSLRQILAAWDETLYRTMCDKVIDLTQRP
jgi:hypothetical protein